MLTKKFVLIAVILSSLLAPMSILRAQDAGALLDLMVKKKLITDQEAEEVRAELTKQVSETSGGKWKLSSPITEIELYGDARVRYEDRGGGRPDDVSGNPNDWQERERERYRLRIGLRGTLADDWFFGIRLETSNKRNSTNVTFGGDGSTGPFAKDDDGIFVGQAYFGYTGFKDIKLTVGRMPQPLVTTLMTWDADINPEGLAEQWKHTFNLEFGAAQSVAASEGYSKDGGKNVAPTVASTEALKLKIDVFANFAQFVYDDANPENPIGPRSTTTGQTGRVRGNQLIPNTDAFLLAWQVGARVTFPKTIYAQFAPTFYNYTGRGDSFHISYRGLEPTL